jgi:hypothetical protein
MESLSHPERMSDERAAKLRQAGFVYLHVAILYEAAAYAMWKRNFLPPTSLGPPWLWLIMGAAVGVLIFYLLYFRQSVWTARVVWAVHGLRLPSLIRGAFFSVPDAVIPPSFYLTAIVIVVVNLWMLARAGWDL